MYHIVRRLRIQLQQDRATPRTILLESAPRFNLRTAGLSVSNTHTAQVSKRTVFFVLCWNKLVQDHADVSLHSLFVREVVFLVSGLPPLPLTDSRSHCIRCVLSQRAFSPVTDTILEHVSSDPMRIRLRQGRAAPDSILPRSARHAVCPCPPGWAPNRGAKAMPQCAPLQLAAGDILQGLLEETGGVSGGEYQREPNVQEYGVNLQD